MTKEEAEKMKKEAKKLTLGKWSVRFIGSKDKELMLMEDVMEIIDKHTEKQKDVSEDVLTVSFDKDPKLIDISGLCVTRKCGEKTIVLKMELGEQADILYRLLTEQMTKAVIKAESEVEDDKGRSNIL